VNDDDDIDPDVWEHYRREGLTIRNLSDDGLLYYRSTQPFTIDGIHYKPHMATHHMRPMFDIRRDDEDDYESQYAQARMRCDLPPEHSLP
jgi:hypothetical protein